MRFAEEQERFAKRHEEYLLRQKRYALRERLRELGLAAILAFTGAPDETMQRGARLAGICCNCGRTLTDPTSLELGIGPECRGFHS
jgi:hypothetical protein